MDLAYISQAMVNGPRVFPIGMMVMVSRDITIIAETTL